jgi:hypothetical protein
MNTNSLMHMKLDTVSTMFKQFTWILFVALCRKLEFPVWLISQEQIQDFNVNFPYRCQERVTESFSIICCILAIGVSLINCASSLNFWRSDLVKKACDFTTPVIQQFMRGSAKISLYFRFSWLLIIDKWCSWISNVSS